MNTKDNTIPIDADIIEISKNEHKTSKTESESFIRSFKCWIKKSFRKLDILHLYYVVLIILLVLVVPIELLFMCISKKPELFIIIVGTMLLAITWGVAIPMFIIIADKIKEKKQK